MGKTKVKEKVICPVCGTENLKSYNYCENEECGFRLDVARQDGLIVGMSPEEIEVYNQELNEKKKEYKTIQKPETSEKVPEYYGERDPFESPEEFIERNISYPYILHSKFDLKKEDYSYESKQFKITLDQKLDRELIPSKANLKEKVKKEIYYYINIDPKEAKYLANSRDNRKIYSKFLQNNNKIEKQYYIVSNNKVYQILTNMQEVLNKIEEKKRKEFAAKQAEERNKHLFWWIVIIIAIGLFFVFPKTIIFLAIISIAYAINKK